MPHFISKNMFMDAPSCVDGVYFAPYFVSSKSANVRILPVIYEIESKIDSKADFNIESKKAQNATPKTPKTPKNTEKIKKITLIYCIHKNDSYLYKLDKITKPPLNIAKKILKILATNLQVITHNLNATNTHAKGFESKFFIDTNRILDSINRLDSINLDAKNTESKPQNILQKIAPQIIEIGFGSGRHILSLAQKNKKKSLLGFEIHAPSIRQTLHNIATKTLQNLYICDMDARAALPLLQEKSLEAIYLHFPVPWNDAPHRRVMSAEFLQTCLALLCKNGVLHLRSDDRAYVDDTIALALECERAHFSVRKNAATSVISKYEARWSSQDKDIYDVYIYADFMESSADSKQSLESTSDFTFDFRLDSLQPFANKKWLFSDTFVSLGDLFIVESAKPQIDTSPFQRLSHDDLNLQNLDSKILKLTFGSFNVPFSTYLILQNGKLSYLLRPLPIKAHILAHKNLCEILKDSKIKTRF